MERERVIRAEARRRLARPETARPQRGWPRRGGCGKMTKLDTAVVELPPLADISAFSTTTTAACLALRDTAQTTATMYTSSAAATESVMASTSLVLPEWPSPVVVFELQEFSPAMSLPHRPGLPLRSSIVSDLILPSADLILLSRGVEVPHLDQLRHLHRRPAVASFVIFLPLPRRGRPHCRPAVTPPWSSRPGSGQPPASIWSNDTAFSFGDILAATEHFNDAYCIGKGIFGTVYRADLGGGRAVAVKRIGVNEKPAAD
uniref:non-specific serine/threonine protein kinase n=1 Tax=Oryza meridionalis TaxID=40149 RepID=A0A0E0E067_9ORYZ